MRSGIHHVCGVSAGSCNRNDLYRTQNQNKIDDLLVTNKTAKYIAHLIRCYSFTNQFLSFCSANIGKVFLKIS
jgi:hypothetical protein